MRNLGSLLIVLTAAMILGGCSEPTQQAAVDSQKEIDQKMKESGDDKSAY